MGLFAYNEYLNFWIFGFKVSIKNIFFTVIVSLIFYL